MADRRSTRCGPASTRTSCGSARPRALAWLAAHRAARPRTDHHYVFPRGGGDLLGAEIEAAARGRPALPPDPRLDGPRAQSQGGLPPDEVVEDLDAILAASRGGDRPLPRPVARTRWCGSRVAPCSPFSVTARADDARRPRSPGARGVRLHTHLAETARRGGVLPRAVRLHARSSTSTRSAGSGDDVWLAHCVHLDDARGRAVRRDRHRRRALPVAPTPGSAPASRRARDLLDAGVAGRARRRRRRVQRGRRAGRRAAPRGAVRAGPRGGPTALTAREALRAGDDRRRAACLGRDDEIGSLEPGKLADLALWRLDGAAATPASPTRSPRWCSAPPPPLELLLVGGRAVVERDRLRHRRRGRAGPRRRRGRRAGCWSGRPMTVTTTTATATATGAPAGVGDRARRGPTARSRSPASSPTPRDLWTDGHAVGRHAAQPAPARADPRRSTSAAALAVPGVHAVLTHEDVPGREALRPRAPRPAGARDRRGPLPGRAGGARRRRPPRDRAPRGRRGSRSTTRCSSRSTDAAARAVDPTAPRLHPARQRACGTSRSATATRTGDRRRRGRRRVRGRHAGPGVPRARVRARGARPRTAASTCYVATQWLHVDQRPDLPRRSACRRRRCGCTLAGVGGAFGGREDLSMQVHACLLALHTGRPVKMVYNREESFFGHVHRHPAHDALRARRRRATAGSSTSAREIVLDGGAYASSIDGRRRQRRRRWASGPTTCPNVAHRLLRRLHQQPAVRRDARLRRGAGRVRATRRRWTGSPPRSGMDPVELRLPQRACREGSTVPTGQVVDAPAPVAELLAARRGDAAAARRAARTLDLRELPGGVVQHHPRRGRAPRRRLRASAYKNIGFSEGFDDYSTARVRLRGRRRRAASSTVHTAAAEVGQGLVTVQAADRPHRARRRRGSSSRPPTPRSARPARRSASRQTYVTGGAVQARLRGGARPGARAAPAGASSAADGRRPRRRLRSPSCSATARSRRPSSGGTGRP